MWALCSKDVVKSVVKYPLKSSYFGKRVVRSDVSPEMKAKFQQVEVGDTATKTNLVSRRSPSGKNSPPKKARLRNRWDQGHAQWQSCQGAQVWRNIGPLKRIMK